MKRFVGRKNAVGKKWLKIAGSLISQFGWSSDSRSLEHGRNPSDAALNNQDDNWQKKGYET
jgi:hypothetical protein